MDILFKQGEAWKKYILHIHTININEGTNMIIPMKLKNNLDISKRHLRRIIYNLKLSDYVEIINNDEKLYLKLTDNAYNRIDEILQDKRYTNYLEQNLEKII